MSAPSVSVKVSEVVLQAGQEVFVSNGVHRISLIGKVDGSIAVTVVSVGTSVSLPLSGPHDAVVQGEVV